MSTEQSERIDEVPLVSFWPLLSGPPSGMSSYFRGLQGGGMKFKELNYRARRGVKLPEVLRMIERDILAPLRNGRAFNEIVRRPWILGGQQFVGHFRPRQLETAAVVVFDLIDILCPDRRQTRTGIQDAWNSMRNIREARIVVTISEYSRQRIVSLYDMDPERVRVIPFGVDSDRFSPGAANEKSICRTTFGLSDSSVVVLYLGSEQRRKNLSTLVAGLAACRKRDPRVIFVKAGASQSSTGRRGFLSSLRIHQMEDATTILDELSETQIVQLYRAADVLAFPSVEEGWGVPVLEAMACGLPIVSSRIGSVEEFAGDAVLYVDDPYSPRDWASAIEALLNKRPLRDQLVETGRRKAIGLSWERARSRFAETMIQMGAS